MALARLHLLGCRKFAVELHLGTRRLLLGSLAGILFFRNGRLYDYDAPVGMQHIFLVTVNITPDFFKFFSRCCKVSDLSR